MHYKTTATVYDFEKNTSSAFGLKNLISFCTIKIEIIKISVLPIVYLKTLISLRLGNVNDKSMLGIT